jgi:hypothetical protein
VAFIGEARALRAGAPRSRPMVTQRVTSGRCSLLTSSSLRQQRRALHEGRRACCFADERVQVWVHACVCAMHACDALWRAGCAGNGSQARERVCVHQSVVLVWVVCGVRQGRVCWMVWVDKNLLDRPSCLFQKFDNNLEAKEREEVHGMEGGEVAGCRKERGSRARFGLEKLKRLCQNCSKFGLN